VKQLKGGIHDTLVDALSIPFAQGQTIHILYHSHRYRLSSLTG